MSPAKKSRRWVWVTINGERIKVTKNNALQIAKMIRGATGNKSDALLDHIQQLTKIIKRVVKKPKARAAKSEAPPKTGPQFKQREAETKPRATTGAVGSPLVDSGQVVKFKEAQAKIIDEQVDSKVKQLERIHKEGVAKQERLAAELERTRREADAARNETSNVRKETDAARREYERVKRENEAAAKQLAEELKRLKRVIGKSSDELAYYAMSDEYSPKGKGKPALIEFAQSNGIDPYKRNKDGSQGQPKSNEVIIKAVLKAKPEIRDQYVDEIKKRYDEAIDAEEALEEVLEEMDAEEEARKAEEAARIAQEKAQKEQKEAEEALENIEKQGSNLDEKNEDNIKQLDEGGASGSGVKWQKAIFGSDKRGLFDNEIDRVMTKRAPAGWAGVFPVDKIETIKLSKTIPSHFVLNTLSSSDTGKMGHWVAVRIDKDTIEYYDAFGKDIPPVMKKRLLKLVSDHHPGVYQLKVNSIQKQSQTSANCGYFAMKFLIDRARGKSFKEATGFKIVDDAIKNSARSTVLAGEANIDKWKKTLKEFVHGEIKGGRMIIKK